MHQVFLSLSHKKSWRKCGFGDPIFFILLFHQIHKIKRGSHLLNCGITWKNSFLLDKKQKFIRLLGRSIRNTHLFWQIYLVFCTISRSLLEQRPYFTHPSTTSAVFYPVMWHYSSQYRHISKHSQAHTMNTSYRN